MSRKPYPEVEDKTDEVIKETFTNILNSGEMYTLRAFRDDILYIANHAPSMETQSWFSSSLDNIAQRFMELFPGRNEPPKKVDVLSVYDALTYNKPSFHNQEGRLYSITFLKSYVDAQEVKNHQESVVNIENLVNDAVEKALPINQIKSDFGVITEKAKELNKEAETSLAALNKEVGKIGVKLYADIFDKQALEHSNLFQSKGMENGEHLGWGLGKAQIWIGLAIMFILTTLFLFLKLDTIFPITNGTEYTPEITLHIIGRIITISMGVFLVSFAFKQFRVNMHLYTLNKHRANTLKSFEYLSKAPDKLDPASYNAILMKVAESIYDAGQTGYISSSESNNDMPSIIDMTKIITPQNK